jgi:membrane protein required for colicin V production
VNWIDIALLVILLLFGLRGYFRGLFREVFSLAGLLAGFIVAARYTETLTRDLVVFDNVPPIVVKAAVFMLCFFVVYVLFNLIGWFLHRCAALLFLGTVNRLGGVVLGLGKGIALAGLVLLAVTSTTLIPPSARDTLDRAYLVSPLSRLADNLIRFGRTHVLTRAHSEARAAAHPRRAECWT